MTQFRVRLVGLLGGPLIRLLASTWRIQEVNAEAWRTIRATGGAFLLSSWHGQLLAHVWVWRSRGMTAVISEHRDGEILARLLESWGYRTLRGSSSRGGGRALLGMVRDLMAGQPVAITPDGPRGPAGQAHPGVLMASQRAQIPIVTIRSDVSRAWHLGSWDRFTIPKPFARIRIVYGDPWIAPSADDAARAELERRMGPALSRARPS